MEIKISIQDLEDENKILILTLEKLIEEQIKLFKEYCSYNGGYVYAPYQPIYTSRVP